MLTPCLTSGACAKRVYVKEFVSDPNRLNRINRQLKVSLRDAAVASVTRWTLHRALMTTGLPVLALSGGRMKFNRSRLGVPREDRLDALCVGNIDAWAVGPTNV